MAEGWLHHYARELGMNLDIDSAGTEKTKVKPDAIIVMQEVGIDLSMHCSKTIQDLSDPWNFDVVITVCNSANEACPTYPAKTTRLHVSFPDPSGESLERWREVRDALGKMSLKLINGLQKGEQLTEVALQPKNL